jgi:hypothetical protein
MDETVVSSRLSLVYTQKAVCLRCSFGWWLHLWIMSVLELVSHHCISKICHMFTSVYMRLVHFFAEVAPYVSQLPWWSTDSKGSAVNIVTCYHFLVLFLGSRKFPRGTKHSVDITRAAWCKFAFSSHSCIAFLLTLVLHRNGLEQRGADKKRRETKQVWKCIHRLTCLARPLSCVHRKVYG